MYSKIVGRIVYNAQGGENMIYKLDNKGLKQKIKEFRSSTYGKCIFLICYLPFIISFVITIIFLFYFYKFDCLWAPPFIISLIFSIISFSIGSYGYYKELRIFVNK